MRKWYILKPTHKGAAPDWKMSTTTLFRVSTVWDEVELKEMLNFTVTGTLTEWTKHERCCKFWNAMLAEDLYKIKITWDDFCKTANDL